MDDPLIGAVLQDRYRIVRKLGEGGMGAVYRGEAIKIGRAVAIKVLHPEFARNPQVVARFHQEAKAATAVGNPHIIEVLDLGELPDGSTYMVLELLQGTDWADDLEKSGPQPLGRVARILSQVCDALESAHAKGIVHRDLKPENIFLISRHGRDDYVKVLDFGISKMLPEPGQDKALTGTNMMLGTAYYMSPEQAKAAKHVDHRSDLYTLGVIFFQALTGYHPFDDDALPLLIIKICTEAPPKLSEYRDDLPPQAQDIFRKLMEKEPAQRYQSAAEVKNALAPFMDHADVSLLADAPDPKTRPASSVELPSAAEARPTQRPTLLIVASLVVGLGVAGAIASQFIGTGDEGDGNEAQPVLPTLDQSPPDPESETEADEVLIYISTRPTDVDATILIDGEPREENPLLLSVERQRSGRPHRIQARAEGFESDAQELMYFRSSEVVLTLTPTTTTRMTGPRMVRSPVGMRTEGPRAETVMTETATTETAMTQTAMETTMQAVPVEPPPTMEETPMVSSMFMGI